MNEEQKRLGVQSMMADMFLSAQAFMKFPPKCYLLMELEVIDEYGNHQFVKNFHEFEDVDTPLKVDHDQTYQMAFQIGCSLFPEEVMKENRIRINYAAWARTIPFEQREFLQKTKESYNDQVPTIPAVIDDKSAEYAPTFNQMFPPLGSQGPY